MALVRAIWVITIAGCYSPAASTGAPCDERQICPRHQVCVNNRCEPEGTIGVDAPMGIDAEIDARVIDAPSLGPWSTPTAVGLEPGVAKTDPSFTPDRLTIVYTRADDIVMATRPAIGQAFTITPLVPLNTALIEKSPEITADGKTIYFVSNRDGTFDVFVTRFVNNMWETPVKVPNLDTAGNEQDVAISPDELTAIIGIAGDVRRSTRATKNSAWPAPTTLGLTWGVNPTAPSVNSAGDVYAHAGATRDIFVARRNGAMYAAPVPVTELNTAGRDAAPFVSADDRHVMFERDGDIFESSR